jgi:5-methylcytosine-specific restriction protein A
MLPPRPCTYPGCPALIIGKGSRCEKHKRQEAKRYDRERGSAASRGYDSRWQRARIVYLKQNPLCIECQKDGRLTPATVVDHKIAHKGNYELFWDVSNWQVLCAYHHNLKTAREDNRWG